MISQTIRPGRSLWLAAIIVGSITALQAPSANAQDIRVIVNGQSVDFNRVGPREYNGRVLVPLRGVLEQLGAYVDWDADNQTVIANKGDTQIQLPIGRRYAQVNGQRVPLDTPAMTIAGSTMVPLRFLSESLGATVRWNDRTSTVRIDTDSSMDSDDRNSHPDRTHRADVVSVVPQVESVTTDLVGDTLQAGDTIEVTMHATPGGKAYFRIRDHVGERKMEEVRPGVYVGRWRCPEDKDCHIDRRDVLAFVVIGARSTAEIHP